MGIAYNTSIVRNGLVLHLDAANSKSYPGSGTAWNDLSGNGNNGTLTNGPAYNSANSGAIVFDGVDDGVNIPHNTNIDVRNQITLECFFKLNSFSSSGPNVDTINLVTKSYSYYTSISPSTQKLLTYFYGTGGYYSSNSSVSLNQWTHTVITFSGTQICWYFNGNVDKIQNQNGSITPTRDGSLGIGRETFENYGRGMDGRITTVRVYNRALTAQEIQQNFEALRGRYGI